MLGEEDFRPPGKLFLPRFHSTLSHRPEAHPPISPITSPERRFEGRESPVYLGTPIFCTHAVMHHHASLHSFTIWVRVCRRQQYTPYTTTADTDAKRLCMWLVVVHLCNSRRSTEDQILPAGIIISYRVQSLVHGDRINKKTTG